MTRQLAAAAAALTLTAAAGPALANDPAEDGADIRTAFDAYIAAANACDMAAAAAFAHPDQSSYHPNAAELVREDKGKHGDLGERRSAFCDAGGGYRWTPEVEEIVLRGDVALVIGSGGFEITRPGGETSKHFVLFTQAWVMEDGAWLLRHAHSSEPTLPDKSE